MRITKLKNFELHDSTYIGDDENAKWWHNAYRESEVYLKITCETRLEDIKRAWPTIVEAQRRLPKYKRRSREMGNQERNQRIVELYREGKRSKEISENVQTEKLGRVEESHVRKIISMYRKTQPLRRVGDDKLRVEQV